MRTRETSRTALWTVLLCLLGIVGMQSLAEEATQSLNVSRPDPSQRDSGTRVASGLHADFDAEPGPLGGHVAHLSWSVADSLGQAQRILVGLSRLGHLLPAGKGHAQVEVGFG